WSPVNVIVQWSAPTAASFALPNCRATFRSVSLNSILSPALVPDGGVSCVACRSTTDFTRIVTALPGRGAVGGGGVGVALVRPPPQADAASGKARNSAARPARPRAERPVRPVPAVMDGLLRTAPDTCRTSSSPGPDTVAQRGGGDEPG